jgi:putative holliday junction resolvase
MTRVLGVDLGARRTGLAISDPLALICSPLAVLQERDVEEILRRVVEMAREHEVDQIVVGLPRPLKGGTNRQLEFVELFVDSLTAQEEFRVSTWDERFTTIMAERGRSGREALDAVAAAYMLQSYLDSLSTARSPG